MNFEGRDQLIRRVQKALNLTADGQDGPKTWSAIEDRVCGTPLEASKTAPDGFPAEFVRVALHEVGIREQSPNWSSRIDQYWQSTWYPTGAKNREPWCAAFICWCFAQAAQRFPVQFKLPRDPKAFGFEDWAEDSGLLRTKNPRASQVKPGDIIVFTFSHIGVCVGVVGNSIFTVEGNTNGDGEREGDGVYRKTRAASLIRSAIHLT